MGRRSLFARRRRGLPFGPLSLWRGRLWRGYSQVLVRDGGAVGVEPRHVDVFRSVPGEEVGDPFAHADELEGAGGADAEVFEPPAGRIEDARIAHRPFAVLVVRGQAHGGRVSDAVDPSVCGLLPRGLRLARHVSGQLRALRLEVVVHRDHRFSADDDAREFAGAALLAFEESGRSRNFRCVFEGGKGGRGGGLRRGRSRAGRRRRLRRLAAGPKGHEKTRERGRCARERPTGHSHSPSGRTLRADLPTVSRSATNCEPNLWRRVPKSDARLPRRHANPGHASRKPSPSTAFVRRPADACTAADAVTG